MANVTVTISNPLTAAQAASLGMPGVAVNPGDVVSVLDTVAAHLIGIGYAVPGAPGGAPSPVHYINAAELAAALAALTTGMLAAASKPDPAGGYSVASGAPTPLDTNLLKVSFAVPTSGRVRVDVGAMIASTTDGVNSALSVWTAALGSMGAYWAVTDQTKRLFKTASQYVSGLTPGATVTWLLHLSSEDGTTPALISGGTTFLAVYGA
jgi:hypothetical protein